MARCPYCSGTLRTKDEDNDINCADCGRMLIMAPSHLHRGRCPVCRRDLPLSWFPTLRDRGENPPCRECADLLVTEQKCEQCEQVLPLGSFTQMTPTKYRSVCKACNLGAAQVQRWAKVGAAARHQQGKMMRATIAR